MRPSKPAPFSAGKPTVGDVEVFFPPIKIHQPDGSVLVKPGRAIVLAGADEINTAEAARILGVSISYVGALCDHGVFLEGQDWRRLGARGNYRLKRASVLRYRLGSPA
jgi:hypothetical protein